MCGQAFDEETFRLGFIESLLRLGLKPKRFGHVTPIIAISTPSQCILVLGWFSKALSLFFGFVSCFIVLLVYF